MQVYVRHCWSFLSACCTTTELWKTSQNRFLSLKTQLSIFPLKQHLIVLSLGHRLRQISHSTCRLQDPRHREGVTENSPSRGVEGENHSCNGSQQETRNLSDGQGCSERLISRTISQMLPQAAATETLLQFNGLNGHSSKNKNH